MEKLNIGDHVGVNFGYSGKFGAAKITGIHETRKKLSYDLEILVSEPNSPTTGGGSSTTRIYNVDSRFVMSRQDWLNYNQSLPEYGKPVSISETYYTSKDIPPVESEEESISETVLIDVDGYRKTFRVGYYHFGISDWVTYANDVKIDLKHMKWTKLNLDKLSL